MVEWNCYCSERTDIKCSCPKTYLHCNDKPRGVGNYHGMCHFLVRDVPFFGVPFFQYLSPFKFRLPLIFAPEGGENQRGRIVEIFSEAKIRGSEN